MNRYKNFDTGQMPEKILASARYHELVLSKIHNGRIAKDIAKSGANIVDKYFGLWLDNQARRDPERFHHLYEWNKTGNKNARLFECEISNSSSPVINFYLKESVEPNDNGHVFSNKATVMESGESVTIEPVDSEVLAFEIEGEMVFTPNEITVENPGGKETNGAFVGAFYNFMSHEAEKSLSSMGFSNTILNTIKNNSDRTLSLMNNNYVINPLQESTITAEMVANAVEVINNEL